MEPPATPVFSEVTLFDAIFAEEEQPISTSAEWLPIGTTEAARMDLYNSDGIESWPVWPEEDHIMGLLRHDTSAGERREATPGLI